MLRKVMLKALFVFLLTAMAFAAPRAEKVGPFSGEASGKIKAVLSSTGYRVFLPNTLAACDVWIATQVSSSSTATKTNEKGALYPELAESTFLGVIVFPKGGGSDFRGQAIRPGSYTMRYALLPNDGNHLGVAPNPDMVLLIPIADDPDPSVNFDFGKLIELSAKAARTGHPAAFEMMPAEAGEPHVVQTDDGWIVFHGTTTKDGKPLPIAVVVKGSSA